MRVCLAMKYSVFTLALQCCCFAVLPLQPVGVYHSCHVDEVCAQRYAAYDQHQLTSIMPWSKVAAHGAVVWCTMGAMATSAKAAVNQQHPVQHVLAGVCLLVQIAHATCSLQHQACIYAVFLCYIRPSTPWLVTCPSSCVPAT